MSPIQIFALALLLLFVVLRVRKMIASKGIPNYSAAEVNSKMKDKNVVLLDVRTDFERKNRHIKGSLHIPLNEIGSRAAELDKHKSREIICYCQSGSRSNSAAIKLKQLGFQSANMIGGMSAWQ
jgi:rhodanese-related sulfurtransferase